MEKLRNEVTNSSELLSTLATSPQGAVTWDDRHARLPRCAPQGLLGAMSPYHAACQRNSQLTSDFWTFIQKKYCFFLWDLNRKFYNHKNSNSSTDFKMTYLRRQNELWELSTHRYYPGKPFQPIESSYGSLEAATGPPPKTSFFLMNVQISSDPASELRNSLNPRQSSHLSPVPLTGTRKMVKF